MITRKEYLNKLIEAKDLHIIKVVTGVRHCGKSTLFALYIDYLRKIGVKDTQIIFINLEALEHEALLDYNNLYTYIKERLCHDKTSYIFIDEVQNCKNFEKAVNSLFIRPNTDLYLTGSNAHMLSGELATLLSGRYITIDMLPFSFKEYYEVGKDAADLGDKNKKFNEYLQFGAFPYIALTEDKNNKSFTYLEGIYNTILLKDVARRMGTADINLLESIVKFLASAVGSPVSGKKITDTLQAQGRRISVNTVESYLRKLTESYIFYKVDRYDVKGRQHLKTLGKYYIVDTGIRNLLLSGEAADLGHLLENVVYFELMRRGYKVNIGKLAEKEVDFVTRNQEGIAYYQVSATVLNPDTLARELAPLQGIPDHHPKLLLTLDEIGAGANYEGIRQQNLIEWLLS